MLENIRDGLVRAIINKTALEADAVTSKLVRPKEFSHGDLAFPCFGLSKDWNLSPPECAKKLSSTIELPKELERSEAAGPYVNFYFKREIVAEGVLRNILKDKFKVGAGDKDREHVILEYSSPNIAKPFHVGHLRNTLLGKSLERIYKHLKYKVTTINHFGDWGTQFGFFFVGCKLWGKPKSETVDELVSRYKRATSLRVAQDEGKVSEEDKDKPDVNEMAKEYFRRLEAGDPEAEAFWKWCLDISMEYFKNVYHSLGIHFDHFTGESFYRDKLKDSEEALRKSGILENSGGALGVDLGKDGFARLFAEDGRSLYLVRDLATAEYRYKTFNPVKILYVVGAPQTLHFKQIVGILKRISHPIAERIVHVSYGNVPGISTRGTSEKSDKILVTQLLQDAKNFALEAYQKEVQKRPDGVDEKKVAEAVGLGAISFEFLSRSNIKEFNFRWDDALNFQGDTGPYLQYALARLNSIENKAKETGIAPDADFDPKLLVDDVAYELVSLLSMFPEVVEKAAREYEPYHIALYLLNLSKRFSGAYKSLRVLGEAPDISRARLALFSSMKYVLHTGLALIGVPPVERM